MRYRNNDESCPVPVLPGNYFSCSCSELHILSIVLPYLIFANPLLSAATKASMSVLRRLVAMTAAHGAPANWQDEENERVLLRRVSHPL